MYFVHFPLIADQEVSYDFNHYFGTRREDDSHKHRDFAQVLLTILAAVLQLHCAGRGVPLPQRDQVRQAQAGEDGPGGVEGHRQRAGLHPGRCAMDC